MDNFQILIDTWEGQGDLDEVKLKEGGVVGIISRLNSMSGGHHMDDTFLSQWEQSKGFIRWPYFVYNPWVNGETNYSWLMNHIPMETSIVSVDIEVKYTNYPPEVYASEVRKFVNLMKPNLKMNIYTGAWFLPVVSEWPSDVDYWWAQYPYTFWYESQTTTWDAVKVAAQKVKWPPSNAASCKGPIKLWQISGDKLTLPGTNFKPTDINLFPGTLEELSIYANQTAPVVPPTLESRVLRLEKYLDWAKTEATEAGISVPEF